MSTKNKIFHNFPIFGSAVLLLAAILSLLNVRTAFGAEKSRVFIHSHDGVTVDKFLSLHDGAEDSLSSGYSYSEEEIEAMLTYLENKCGNAVDLSSAAKAVYLWQKETGADTAALLSLLYFEGGMSNPHGVEHWNFYTLPCPQDGTAYSSTAKRTYWDAKKDCNSVGEALIKGMSYIYDNYFAKGQDSFYKMSFNAYGYPQNIKEAVSAESGIYHSYLPWWDDVPYISTGYNSAFCWVNRLTEYRKDLRKVAEGV